MFLVAWFTGSALGLVLLALKPWFPAIRRQLFTSIYQRANMIASGKMFVVNMLPPTCYNDVRRGIPCFTTSTSARGFVFINYFPHNSSFDVSDLWARTCSIVLGLIGEFYTRRHASASWEARR